MLVISNILRYDIYLDGVRKIDTFHKTYYINTIGEIFVGKYNFKRPKFDKTNKIEDPHIIKELINNIKNSLVSYNGKYDWKEYLINLIEDNSSKLTSYL